LNETLRVVADAGAESILGSGRFALDCCLVTFPFHRDQVRS